MDLAGYVINAVLVEGRSVAEVAADHGVSRSWLYELLARYRAEGEGGLKPKSRRPRSAPMRVSAEMEEEIVARRCSTSASAGCMPACGCCWSTTSTSGSSPRTASYFGI